MSLKVMAQVWDDQRIKSQSQLLVLLALANDANDDHFSFPAVPRIAQYARLSERQAQRVLQDLENNGIIYKKTGRGRGRFTRYIIAIGINKERFEKALAYFDDLNEDERQSWRDRFGKGDAIVSSITTQKGDIMSPIKPKLEKPKPAEKVTFETIKGDILSTEKSAIPAVSVGSNGTHKNADPYDPNTKTNTNTLRSSLTLTTFSRQPEAALHSQLEATMKEQERNEQLQAPPDGHVWIESSASHLQGTAHLAPRDAKHPRPLCKAVLQHIGLLHPNAMPCAECVRIATMPKKLKNAAPPDEVKEFLAELCYGPKFGALIDSSKGSIVKEWNRMKCPPLDSLGIFKRWWYAEDWRGKKNQKPKPYQVTSEWDTAMAWGGGTGQDDAAKEAAIMAELAEMAKYGKPRAVKNHE